MNLEKYITRELKIIANCLNSRRIEKNWTVEIPKPIYHIIKPMLLKRLHRQVITEYPKTKEYEISDGIPYKMYNIRLMIGDSYLVKSYGFNRPLLLQYIKYLNYKDMTALSFHEHLNHTISSHCLATLQTNCSLPTNELDPESLLSNLSCIMLYALCEEGKTDFKKLVNIFSKLRSFKFYLHPFNKLITNEIDKIRLIENYNKDNETCRSDFLFKSLTNTYQIRVTSRENDVFRLYEDSDSMVEVTQSDNSDPHSYGDIQMNDDGFSLIEMKHYGDETYFEFNNALLQAAARMTPEMKEEMNKAFDQL